MRRPNGRPSTVSLEAQTTRSEAEQRGRAEDVVGAQHVDLECPLDGADPRRRDGRQVDDRIRAAERLDRLAEVGQVRPEERRIRRLAGDDVDVDDVVAVLDEIAHHCPARLAAAAGHHDLGHRRSSGQCLWLGNPWIGCAGCSNSGSMTASAARRSSSHAPNDTAALRRQELGFDRRDEPRRYGTDDSGDDGFDPRDVPAVLRPDGPDDRPRPRRRRSRPRAGR